MKQNASGLFVPLAANTSPMSSLPAGRPSSKPDRRSFVGSGSHQSDPAPGSWGAQDAPIHVRGRADSTAQILLGVAVLKQKGFIWNYVVNYTGAVWQDRKGTTPLSNRAHCLPCNPTITNQNIPDIAPTHVLRSALIEPLAKTDFLHKITNHCDSRFESLGAAASFANAVRLIAREQEREKPVNFDAFFHALNGIALAGYRAAYESVRTEALAALNQESGLGQKQRDVDYSPTKPKTSLEAIVETADDLCRATVAITSVYSSQTGFTYEVNRLQQLAAGSDLISRPLR